MPRSLKFKTGLVLSVLLLLALWHFLDDSVFRFPGLSGPALPSVVTAEKPTSTQAFGGGETSRLAVLLTDRDSSWLGLVHGLKSFGSPFTLTEDYQEALKHRVVMVYPVLSGKVMTLEALSALAAFPAKGGTLIATNVLGGCLNELFGFSQAVSSTAHSRPG